MLYKLLKCVCKVNEEQLNHLVYDSEGALQLSTLAKIQITKVTEPCDVSNVLIMPVGNWFPLEFVILYSLRGDDPAATVTV